ncbi:hypothetical protein [Caballeronia sp. dw_19]|uniref:hypothetical protein n=1 Tax=Caballeronia sp. dw_19 TaxID=2719791 RepID=UPI001BD69D0E|nr:hypothetical protein [Caballeronia sp. dw_19]
MQDKIESLEYLAAEIENEDLAPFIKTMNGDGELTSVIAIHLDCELPLCLAGKSGFKSGNKKYTVHLSIFPKPGQTFCCFSLPKRHDLDFRKILEKYESDFEFLKFVESWMIYGTDFWYINPLEWDGYSTEKKEKILTKIKNTDHFPDEDLDFTIFDTLRTNLKRLEKQSSQEN